jgi:hypothetical protein
LSEVKEISHRYNNAEALADDLHRFLSGELIRARPVRFPEHIWKWAKRRPAAASLVMVVILGVICSLAGILWYEDKVRTSADRLRQESFEKQQEEQRAALAEANITARVCNWVE